MGNSGCLRFVANFQRGWLGPASVPAMRCSRGIVAPVVHFGGWPLEWSLLVLSMPARFLSSGLVERIGHGPTKTTLEQKVEQAERTGDKRQEQGQARRLLLGQTSAIDPHPDKEIKGQIMRPASKESRMGCE